MSRVRRRISRVVAGEAKWPVCWPPIYEVDTQPPDAATQVLGPTYYTPIPDDGLGPRPFSDFYITAGSKTDDFWNSFFNRAPVWEFYADDSHSVLPGLLISPGGGEGLSEPMAIPLDGAPDWDVLFDNIAIIGDRSSFIKAEEQLPNYSPSSISESEGSFQYTRTISYQSNISLAAIMQRTYTFKVLAHEGILYNGAMFFPCVHSDVWSYTDDGGSSGGGWISNYIDLPFVGTLHPTSIYETKIRLGTREHSSVQHTAFSFSAYKDSTPTVDGAGQTDTDILGDPPELEVAGIDTPSEVWIQPDRHSPDIYFGYRSDNDDDSTALYDPDTGHLTLPEADFPLTM